MMNATDANSKVRTRYKIENDNVRIVVKGLNADGVEEKLGYWYNRHAVEDKLPMLKKSLAAGMRESKEGKLKLSEIPTFEADLILSYASDVNLDEAKKKLENADFNKLLEVVERLEIDLAAGAWLEVGKAILAECEPRTLNYTNVAAAIKLKTAEYDSCLDSLAQNPKLGEYFAKLSSDVVGDLLQRDDLCLDESQLLAAVQGHFAARQAVEGNLDRTEADVKRIYESLRWEHININTIILDIDALVPALDDTTRGIILAQRVKNEPVLGKDARPQRRKTEIQVQGDQVKARCWLRDQGVVQVGHRRLGNVLLSRNILRINQEQHYAQEVYVKAHVGGEVFFLGQMNCYQTLQILPEYFDASGAVHLSLSTIRD